MFYYNIYNPDTHINYLAYYKMNVRLYNLSGELDLYLIAVSKNEIRLNPKYRRGPYLIDITNKARPIAAPRIFLSYSAKYSSVLITRANIPFSAAINALCTVCAGITSPENAKSIVVQASSSSVTFNL